MEADLIGYLLQSKKTRDLFSFDGAKYSLIAIIIFFLLDFLRVILRNTFGFLPYPWEKIIFEGSPIITLIVVAVIAIILEKYNKIKVSDYVFKWLFVAMFIAQQVFTYIYPTVISTIPQLSIEALLSLLLGIIITPLFVAAAAYALLSSVKEPLNRAFFSSIIATIYGSAYLISYEFSINPTTEATDIFGYVALALVVACMTVLIWQARKTARLQ